MNLFKYYGTLVKIIKLFSFLFTLNIILSNLEYIIKIFGINKIII